MIPRNHAQFKATLRAGEFLVGTWVTSSDPMMTEVVASAGFDFLILDAEHGPVTPLTALTTQLVADRTQVPMLVRIPTIDPVPIMSALDFGAAGILVPRVTCAADADRAVRLAYYPRSVPADSAHAASRITFVTSTVMYSAQPAARRS